MLRNAALMLVLCLVTLGGREVFAQKAENISGKVVHMDVEGGVIDVQTVNGIQQFFIVAESDLFMSAHHMSSVEIAKGDPVDIVYYVDAKTNKDIIKLVDNNKTNV